MQRHALVSFGALFVASLCATGCGDSAGPERSGAPTDIRISAGNGQTGAAASVLVAPLAVKVTDAKGRGVPNIDVSFQAMPQSGEVHPASARTNGAGIATTSWTLPTIAGPGYAVRAVFIDTLTGALIDSVTFSATVVGGTPIYMYKGGFTGLAPTGSTTEPLTVALSDRFGNPSPGATVTWTVTSGGGTVSPATSVSDANGLATARLTLGTTAGMNSVRATTAGLTASFDVEGRVPGTPARIVFGGVPFAAAVGSSFPVTAYVYDGLNTPVPNATITWSASVGGGSFALATSVSNGSGIASNVFTLGATPGTYGGEASAGGVTASFTVSGRLMTTHLTTFTSGAYGLARTSNGTFVVSMIQSGNVQRFSQATPDSKVSIQTGGTPVIVGLDPAGTFAYVSNMDGWLDIIDVATNTIVHQVPVPNAHALAVSPSGDRVYVTSSAGMVYRVSTSSRTIVDSVAVPGGPWGIAFRATATDSLMYVTSRDAGTVTEIDMKTNVVKRTFTVGGRPHGLVISPDGQTLYAADNSDGRVKVVNIASGGVQSGVALYGAFGIAISPDGSTLFATTDDGYVAVIASATMTVTRKLETGGHPRQVIASPDGTTAWAANEYGWIDVTTTQ
jgi:YVTN family beta-propeller protein